jgi:hypothetical protein
MEAMMRTIAVVVASCALLVPIAPAGAGQCANEIDNLAKTLAAHDAGSGPSAGAPGSAMGQHPPTSAMSQADSGGTASMGAAQSGKPQHPPTATMNRETTGSSSAPMAGDASKEQHPPTATMNRETQGAASPQDVQRQTQGQPTAAQQAQGQIGSSHTLASAMAALERARLLDRQGNEAECMSAVGQAKLISGAR